MEGGDHTLTNVNTLETNFIAKDAFVKEENVGTWLLMKLSTFFC